MDPSKTERVVRQALAGRRVRGGLVAWRELQTVRRGLLSKAPRKAYADGDPRPAPLAWSSTSLSWPSCSSLLALLRSPTSAKRENGQRRSGDDTTLAGCQDRHKDEGDGAAALVTPRGLQPNAIQDGGQHDQHEVGCSGVGVDQHDNSELFVANLFVEYHATEFMVGGNDISCYGNDQGSGGVGMAVLGGYMIDDREKNGNHAKAVAVAVGSAASGDTVKGSGWFTGAVGDATDGASCYGIVDENERAGSALPVVAVPVLSFVQCGRRRGAAQSPLRSLSPSSSTLQCASTKGGREGQLGARTLVVPPSGNRRLVAAEVFLSLVGGDPAGRHLQLQRRRLHERRAKASEASVRWLRKAPLVTPPGEPPRHEAGEEKRAAPCFRRCSVAGGSEEAPERRRTPVDAKARQPQKGQSRPRGPPAAWNARVLHEFEYGCKSAYSCERP